MSTWPRGSYPHAALGRTDFKLGNCPEPGAAILLRPDRLPPPAVFEIPNDGLAQPGLEALARPPAELALDLAGLHRIAPVMTGSVGDKADQPLMRPVRRFWDQLVE